MSRKHPDSDGKDWEWVEKYQNCRDIIDKDAGAWLAIEMFSCPISPGKWTMLKGSGKCVRVRKTPTCPANYVWADDPQVCTEKKKELMPGEIQNLKLMLACPTGPGNWTWKIAGVSCVQSSVKA